MGGVRLPLLLGFVAPAFVFGGAAPAGVLLERLVAALLLLPLPAGWGVGWAFFGLLWSVLPQLFVLRSLLIEWWELCLIRAPPLLLLLRLLGPLPLAAV